MRKILKVEVKDYEIILTDNNFSQLREEIFAHTKGQKKLFVASKNYVYLEISNVFESSLRPDSTSFLSPSLRTSTATFEPV